jgi:hypothetical protein
MIDIERSLISELYEIAVALTQLRCDEFSELCLFASANSMFLVFFRDNGVAMEQ